jgi:hypothetical protein
MIPDDKAHLLSDNRLGSDAKYCPECGQPLTLARATPTRRGAVSWRSIFLVAVGLYLSITFGIGVWHAEQANQVAADCPGTGVEMDCASAPRNFAKQLASQYFNGKDVLAVRLTERDAASDVRFAAVGIFGLFFGLAAAVVRLRHPHRKAFGTNLLFVLEGPLVVFYGEVLLLSVYLLVNDLPQGAPLAFGNVDNDVFRALSMIFSLVGAV